MEHNIEKCPKCENYTEGKPVYSQTRQMTRAAVKKGSSQLIGAGIGFFVGIFFGFVGCVPGAIVGYVIGLLVSSSSTVNDMTDSVDQQLYSSTLFRFDCPRCGQSWQKTYQNGADTVPDAVLEKQKSDLLQRLRGDAGAGITSAVVFGLMAAASAYYCLSHESSSTHTKNVWLIGDTEVTDYNWTWWLLCLVAVVCFFVAFSFVSSVVSKRAEAKTVEQMSVDEYRHSAYRK